MWCLGGVSAHAEGSNEETGVVLHMPQGNACPAALECWISHFSEVEFLQTLHIIGSSQWMLNTLLWALKSTANPAWVCSLAAGPCHVHFILPSWIYKDMLNTQLWLSVGLYVRFFPNFELTCCLGRKPLFRFWTLKSAVSAQPLTDCYVHAKKLNFYFYEQTNALGGKGS